MELSLPNVPMAAAPAPRDIARSRSHTPAKLSSAAQEFESILLGQWLQAAESSFGSAPGGEVDADADGEQMQGFAVQSLATQLARSGGIGIASLVQSALETSAANHTSAGHEASLHRLSQIESVVSGGKSRAEERKR